uniref:Multidrug and toxin extrusion protein n=1 Tax=Schmidtea mediterranea TaxID=79327 RepID=A0A0H3YJN6_SCHMD|nr:slc47a-7 [Schmidtea mediterranea]
MNLETSFCENETSPLMENLEHEHEKFSFKQMRKELLLLVKIAIPIILTNLCGFLILTESIIIAGHISKYELDACALANSVINVAGIAVATGLCTACDTLFSQMYGSKHRKAIGAMLIKSTMIITIFPILLIALHINMEPLFILMGQDKIVAKDAARYMVIFSPGLLFGFYFLILTRYMQNQNKVLPPMIIGIIVNIFNVVSQYLTVYYFKLGFDFSAICQAITFLLFWALELAYILIAKLYEETWDGWTRDVFLEWGLFTKLAIPGAAMVIMECFCFEIGTLLSGVMGPLEMAAQSVLFQLETITFMISFGVGISVNIRVGQYLGSGKPQQALKVYRYGLLVMMSSFVLTSSLILGFKDYLPLVFTNDGEAQKLSSELLPILVGVQFFDAFGTVTMGALRGCGRQKICVLLIFCSFYLLGQPIGISLAFVAQLKVQGLWIGLLVSLAICVPIAVIYTNFIQDWQHQANLCQKRIAEARHQQENEEFKNETIESRRNSFQQLEYFKASHRRSISKSFSVSVPGNIMVTKYVEVTEKTYTKAYITKFIIFFSTLCVLIMGILVKLYLPRELYWPLSNSTSH